MIMWFEQYSTKLKVMKLRKKLKGPGITVTDNLCRDYKNIQPNEKRPEGGRYTAYNGRVYYKIKGIFHNVTYGYTNRRSAKGH